MRGMKKRVLGTAGLVMLSEVKHLCAGFLALGMNCDEKTKFQVLFKCSLTTRLCSQTELAVG
jgi:hypothetical protein